MLNNNAGLVTRRIENLNTEYKRCLNTEYKLCTEFKDCYLESIIYNFNQKISVGTIKFLFNNKEEIEESIIYTGMKIKTVFTIRIKGNNINYLEILNFFENFGINVSLIGDINNLKLCFSNNIEIFKKME